LLRDCRVEVARQKRTDTAAVTANGLTLRWTVLPSGQVTDTQVVATSPVDGRVIDCVKRQMSQWSFSPPTGGPARVERPFKFR
jgi:outer membrane biosynthesis protein TonB